MLTSKEADTAWKCVLSVDRSVQKEEKMHMGQHPPLSVLKSNGKPISMSVFCQTNVLVNLKGSDWVSGHSMVKDGVGLPV